MTYAIIFREAVIRALRLFSSARPADIARAAEEIIRIADRLARVPR